MIHLMIAVLLALLLLYMAALYESAALVMLASGLLGLVVSAVVVLLWRVHGLQVTFSVPMTLAQSGDPLGVHFTIRAEHGMLGKTQLRVKVESRQLPGRRTERTWIRLEAPSSGTQTLRKEVTMHCAGGYRFRMLRMRIYDWTGWFYLTRYTKQTAATYLLPQVNELPLQLSAAVRNFFGESEVYDDLRGGTDPSEVFQIRPYAPGDRLQNIHWKLSAKSEELMVREHSLPKGCAVVLLLGARNMEKLSHRQRDRYLQIAAAISFALTDADCPHIVSWYDDVRQDLVRMRVDDEEGFYEWQLLYLPAQIRQTDMDVEARYVEKYGSEPILHRIRLESELSVYVDGQLWHTFQTLQKKKSIKEELEGLTLYL